MQICLCSILYIPICLYGKISFKKKINLLLSELRSEKMKHLLFFCLLLYKALRSSLHFYKFCYNYSTICSIFWVPPHPHSISVTKQMLLFSTLAANVLTRQPLTNALSIDLLHPQQMQMFSTTFMFPCLLLPLEVLNQTVSNGEGRSHYLIVNKIE